MLQHANEDVEKMILGNKCDMEDKRQVSKDRGESVSELKTIMLDKRIFRRQFFVSFATIHDIWVLIAMYMYVFTTGLSRQIHVPFFSAYGKCPKHLNTLFDTILA